MRKPAERPVSIEAPAARGAKGPRSVYLGGRAEVRHLLLGGRAEKMVYKQRVQVEEDFCRFFLPTVGVESGKI